MKKKLRLKTVLKIKKHLEDLIEETYDDIIRYNETDIKVDVLFDRLEAAIEQLIAVKEAVQKANQGKHKTGKTNNYYIYKYSELQARKRFLNRISGVDPEHCQISPDEAKVMIRKLNAELDVISSKLTNFNTRKRVTVTLDPILKLDFLLDL